MCTTARTKKVIVGLALVAFAPYLIVNTANELLSLPIIHIFVQFFVLIWSLVLPVVVLILYNCCVNCRRQKHIGSLPFEEYTLFNFQYLRECLT